MKTALIWNPVSGKTTGTNLKEQVRSFLTRSSELISCQTRGRGEATQLVKDALGKGVRSLIVAGGDGTLGEVINGLEGRFQDVTLGILPTGTGNDFARSLGLDLDLDQSLKNLQRGVIRSVDVVRVTAGNKFLRNFVNVCVTGLDPQGSERIEAEFKNNWGLLGYLLAGFEAVNEIHSHRLELQFENQKPIHLEGSILVLGNGGFMSAGIPILPGACVDDGKIDVLVLRPTTVARLTMLAPWVLTGTHLTSPDVFHQRASQMTLRGTPDLHLLIDDYVFHEPEYHFEVLPGVLKVIVPASTKVG